jgi:hypothetical protein
MEACNIDEGVPESINGCTPPCRGRLIRSRTFLALTRAAVSCAEGSDVSLCAGGASLTECLGMQLLVIIAEAQAVAADAAELPALGLEESCAERHVTHSLHTVAKTTRTW